MVSTICRNNSYLFKLEITANACNDNNNNNNKDDIYCAVIALQALQEFNGSSGECRMPVGWQHPDQANRLFYESAIRLLPDTHFTVPQRVAGWVYLSTAGRCSRPFPRLRIIMSVAVNATTGGVIRTWILSRSARWATARPLRPPRWVGMNNLLKVVARQRGIAGIRTRDCWVASQTCYHTAVELTKQICQMQCYVWWPKTVSYDKSTSIYFNCSNHYREM